MASTERGEFSPMGPGPLAQSQEASFYYVLNQGLTNASSPLYGMVSSVAGLMGHSGAVLVAAAEERKMRSPFGFWWEALLTPFLHRRWHVYCHLG